MQQVGEQAKSIKPIQSAQEKLSKMGWAPSRIAHATGLHVSVVSRTLRGESRSAAAQLVIAKFAGLSPRELFGDHCNPTLASVQVKARQRKGGSRAA